MVKKHHHHFKILNAIKGIGKAINNDTMAMIEEIVFSGKFV
jgi:hypothetical protein